MVSVVACLVLGLTLVTSAVLKAADARGTQAALATYGIRSHGFARVAWGVLVAVEAALGVAVAAGIDAAAYAAGALLALFCAAQATALASGRGGAPCACFGAWSTRPLSWWHVARNGAMMALAVVAIAA